MGSIFSHGLGILFPPTFSVDNTITFHHVKFNTVITGIDIILLFIKTILFAQLLQVWNSQQWNTRVRRTPVQNSWISIQQWSHVKWTCRNAKLKLSHMLNMINACWGHCHKDNFITESIWFIDSKLMPHTVLLLQFFWFCNLPM